MVSVILKEDELSFLIDGENLGTAFNIPVQNAINLHAGVTISGCEIFIEIIN